MMSRRMHFVLLLVLAAVCWANQPSGAAPGDEADLNQQIAVLKAERRETLRARLKVVKAMHESGNLPYERVFSAQDDLFGAELALATSRPDRVKLCMQRIENLRSLEKVMSERQQQGQGGVTSPAGRGRRAAAGEGWTS